MAELTCPEALQYWPAAHVRRLRLGGRSAFFCEYDQRLYELNATADAIWTALDRAGAMAEAETALVAMGAEPAQARAYVHDQLQQWLRGGHWTDRAAPEAEPLRFAVDALHAEVACREPHARARLTAVFAPFSAFIDAPSVTLNIEAVEGGYDLREDGGPPVRVAAETLIPQVKALLTRKLVDGPRPGFFAHGALLAAGGSLILISGAPGAGKTTLALSLAAAGWNLLADDVIRVDDAGLFTGVPFAPAVKAGAWPLLAERAPNLEALPIDLRPDGQRVRYATGWTRAAAAQPLNLFIALDRDGQAQARSRSIDQLDALALLLSEAYAADHRLSADLMARLAERFQTVRSVRLSYGGLDEAVAEIGRLNTAERHAA